MKITSLILILMTLSASAFAQIPLVGTFSEPVQTFMMSYVDEASCIADQGDWDTEMEVCFFDASNNAKISENEKGLFLEIDTIGANAHSCFFEGQVTSTTENTVVAEAESMTWNGDDWVDGICEVTVNYSDENTVDISTNGQCQDFCGARAWLEFGPATRI